jgi:hypothetical protein
MKKEVAPISNIYCYNQIKLYDSWAVRASEAVAETYGFESPKYWYDTHKHKKVCRDSIGGTSVLNYADALQYVGKVRIIKNRYKSV